MKNILFTGMVAFLATAVASGAHHSTDSDEECVVNAWVRAEDLAPDHVSHGELRIKVKQAHCANRIASVALRLQLDEFSEVKYLRHGAVIPEIQKSHNQNAPEDFLAPLDGTSNNTVYDYGPYDRALSEAALWEVKAEERIAWSTEAVLFENNPDFSQAMVTPFIVASPAVNYPPSVYNRRGAIVTALPVKRHAYSVVGYRYTAVVNFTDGRSVDVPAGHTNFAPTSPEPPPKAPFTWNVTFTNNFGCEELPSTHLDDVRRCLPEELRSVFVAEVTLPDGNVVERGQLLKGRMTVHSTNGSTEMSDVAVAFATTNDNQWAMQQAETGGDQDYRKLLCEESRTRGVVSTDAFPSIFQMDTDLHDSYTHGRLSTDKPYMDFELEIQPSAAPGFPSYYSSGEASLHLSLGVLYSEDASVCIDGEKYSSTFLGAQKAERTAAEAARNEENLWDTHTPVDLRREPDEPGIDYRRRLQLVATVPLVVLGDVSARQVEHYLQPGLPSPIILAAQADSDPVFPIPQPEIIEEPLENTSARLMRSEGTHDPTPPPNRSRMGIGRVLTMRYPRGTPDPANHYRTGPYAGLLWKKKAVAAERGLLLPVPAAEVAQVEDNGQQGFIVAPPAFERHVRYLARERATLNGMTGAKITTTQSAEPVPKIWNPPSHTLSPAERSEFIASHFPTFPSHLLLFWFECDWENYRFFYIRQGWYNLSRADAILTHVFKICGPFRPLVYRTSANVVVLVAAADGEYYMWNDDAETLSRFGGGFASDEHFLARVSVESTLIEDHIIGVPADLPSSYYKQVFRRGAAEAGTMARRPTGARR